MKVLGITKFRDEDNLMVDLIKCLEEMKEINNPFILKEIYALRDEYNKICIISNLHSSEIKSFTLTNPYIGCQNKELTKIYGAEILIAIEYLHQKGIILGKSLKPNNILLEKGHVRLCDIRISEILSKYLRERAKKGYMERYREYYAPEIVEGKEFDQNADWWNFGVTLCNIYYGRPIIYSDDENKLTFSKVKNFENIDKEFGGLISSLLNEDPAKRLGAGKDGIEEIKRHDFFKEIDWSKIEKKKVKLPKLS